MAKLEDQTVASTYKDLLYLNNSNSGIPTNPITIQDGNGSSTSIALGTKGLAITPSADNTSTFLVENAGGTDLLKVDTTNALVKVNETQSIANTQYLRFGAKDIDVDNGTHIGVPIAGMGANAVVTFGTGTNPAVPTISNNGDDWVHYFHYVDTNITVDSVQVLWGATTATGDTLNFHLNALITGDTVTVDEFSSIGAVVADSSLVANDGYEVMKRTQLTVQSADVDAGKYLALTVEGNGTNSDYSINALVRYHLR